MVANPLLTFQIRAKRLARLAALNESSSSRNSPPVEKPPTPATETPKSAAPAVSRKKDAPRENEHTAEPAEKTRKLADATPIANPEQAMDNWIRSQIPGLFEVGFQGNGAKFSSFGSTILTLNLLEDAFVEILTDLGVPGQMLPMAYLFQVYTRTFTLKRILRKKDPLYDEKLACLNSIIRYATSYALICFQIPEMVIGNDLDKAVTMFIEKPNTHPFLVDVVSRAVELEFLVDLLGMLFPAISVRLHGFNLHNPQYASYLTIWETLVSIKAVAAVFSQIPGFLPPDASNGLDYEHKTLLGPLLRLSPLDENVALSTFAGGQKTDSILELTDSALLSIYTTVQSEFKATIERIWFIADKLVRGSPQTRSDLLKWFADLANVSHLRTGSHSDTSKLASDALMFNISYLLIRFSMPFLDFPMYSKLSKIDPDYFGPKCKLIDVSEESRVYASAKEAAAYYESAMEEDVNFISDCFFLTLTYLQYGIGGMITNFGKMKDEIKHFERQRERFQDQRMVPMLARLYARVNALKCKKYAIDALSFFRTLNMEIFDFIVGACQFMVRSIDPTHKHPSPKVKIPLLQIEFVSQLDDYEFLKSKSPEPWKYFPEFVVEGIINYCKFITSYNFNPLMDNPDKLSIFAEFATILLRCPELIGNPHMKGNIVEIFFMGTLPMRHGSPGYLADIYETNALVKDNLLYSLLDIYVMIEKTGASSQFYDKFNTRFYISKIVEDLWKIDHYKQQLSGYSKHNVDFFIRFIARMLNDTTFLFDESFNELNTIHKLQEELKARARGGSGNEEEFGSTEDVEKNLQSAESKAQSYMGLANETMKMFMLFTKQVPEGFTIDELVDRLAGMLDYNLSLMVGPKCSNLKVKEPEKYKFEPKKILADICNVYCNLSKQEKFVLAVARDGRSFSMLYFDRAKEILTKRTSVSQDVIDVFYNFGRRAEEQRLVLEQQEMDLGEVPDELLDPLMFTLMEDPVILPGSKVTIDRSTIKAHLLSDATDPFNRMPLKLDDVIDDVETREKINLFKQGKYTS